ncbi:cytochrome P450 [Streptomyces aureus]|uniref:Cytochrome P450 n=1 Tax=Streptomyces aureus TaxID=193461 RepID=A0ABV4SZQ7_9ACTN
MSDSETTTAPPVEELVHHLDLFDPAHHERVWEVLKHARESECPVIKTDADHGYFIITTYDDLRDVANDPETFSSVEPALRGVPVRLPPISEDPPIHTDFRKLLNPYFSRSYLQRYEQSMRYTARELLEPLLAKGRMEFMSDFALPFTAANLTRLVLDEKDQARLARAKDASVRISTENTQQAWFDLAQVATEFLAEREASGTEADDLLSAIGNGSVAGRPLTAEEQVGIVATLFIGGLDTTRAALGNITRRMAEDSTIEARLREPDWLAGDLDEFLRFESPITFLARTVTRDTEVNGCPMHAGDRVALHYASANRDEQHFDKADELALDRKKNPHLAFGIGRHRCLGLHFARLQIGIGIEEILNRITHVRLAPGAEVAMANGVILAPETLPIEFDLRKG